MARAAPARVATGRTSRMERSDASAVTHDGTARYELGGRPLAALLCLLARADAATLRAALLAPPADAAGGLVCWDSADGALRVVATGVKAVNGGWHSRELSGRLGGERRGDAHALDAGLGGRHGRAVVAIARWRCWRRQRPPLPLRPPFRLRWQCGYRHRRRVPCPAAPAAPSP